ncbi:ribonuclease D [Micrococcales bacterium 31B]|nr:ribonuclease D [Micrococcales bacterium 31B]
MNPPGNARRVKPAVVTTDTEAAAGTTDGAGDAPEVEIHDLTAPREGVPAVVADQQRLAEVITRFGAGHGPVAFDAERASGFTYGQEAYLVQLRRAGAGTALIDPIACPDLSGLGQALGDSEWIFHAASQDLACLAEVGLKPSRIFDTEVGARLLNLPRVGLGFVLAHLLHVQLAKEHSAVNWSQRPLHRDWLIYAALDVELLIELREVMVTLLEDADKAEWARQEFEAIRLAPPPGPKVEPWRRTSKVHEVRSRRGLAIVRELWQTRDRIARNRNVAPGRVLSDASILAATRAKPTRIAELTQIGAFASAKQRKYAPQWLQAIAAGMACPEDELPTITPPPGALGRTWRTRDPDALDCLAVLRECVHTLASAANVPAENLLTPEYLRRMSSDHQDLRGAESVADLLTEFGARPWQLERVAAPLAKALADYGSGFRVQRDAQSR